MAKGKGIFIVLGVIIFACFIIELALRFTGDLYLKKLYIHWRPTEVSSLNSTNIICLGESLTAGLWVNQQESYPFQLQAMLRSYYPSNKINVYVPPHVGQNTSQMANRIEQYVKFYKPRLIIIMAGYNNEWSLAESHIGKFYHLNNFQDIKINALVFLDNLRLFRLIRYAYFRYIFNKQESHYNFKMKNLRLSKYLWGGPELVVPSPKEAIENAYFAFSHIEAFLKLWRYDIEKIISTAKKHQVKVLLMTYHINASYLPAEEFIAMADKEEVGLVRNDLTFASFIQNGTIGEYLLHDKWHLNKKGYYFIANNAFEAIKNNRLLIQ